MAKTGEHVRIRPPPPPEAAPEEAADPGEAAERSGAWLAIVLPIFRPDLRPMIAGAVGFIVFLAGLGWGALWLDSRAQATIRTVATDVVAAKAAENADQLRGMTDDVRDLKAHVKNHDEQFDKLNEKLDHIGTTVDTTAGEVQTLIAQRHH